MNGERFHRVLIGEKLRFIRERLDLFENSKSVIPAKAGIQTAGVVRWIPAYAGMTTGIQE